jgi:hypothetical protein
MLKYLRPTSWSMSDAELDLLDAEGLRYFPLTPFLEQYTAQVDALVRARSEEAATKARDAQARAEAAEAECAQLRAELARCNALLAPPPQAAAQ